MHLSVTDRTLVELYWQFKPFSFDSCMLISKSSPTSLCAVGLSALGFLGRFWPKAYCCQSNRQKSLLLSLIDN